MEQLVAGEMYSEQDELLRDLEASGHPLSSLAKNIMSKHKFTTLVEGRTIYVASAKIHDLGFTANPTTTELWARIKEVNALYPTEAGSHLRLTPENQPNGDRFWVAIEQIAGLRGYPGIFYMERRRNSDGRWLGGCQANPDDRWDLSSEIVFVFSK